MAEQLPQADGWDWTVWRLGDAQTARHGAAASVEAAMLAAEDVGGYFAPDGSSLAAHIDRGACTYNGVLMRT